MCVVPCECVAVSGFALIYSYFSSFSRDGYPSASSCSFNINVAVPSSSPRSMLLRRTQLRKQKGESLIRNAKQVKNGVESGGFRKLTSFFSSLVLADLERSRSRHCCSHRPIVVQPSTPTSPPLGCCSHTRESSFLTL